MSAGFRDLFALVLGWKASDNTIDDSMSLKPISANDQKEGTAIIADATGHVAKAYGGTVVDTIDEMNERYSERFHWVDGGRGFFSGK